jgi:hypothetical protein
MRSVLMVGLVCGLLGCSAAPTQWQPPLCRHDSRDCSPAAVHARVLDAFPDLQVQEVLACADQPSMFCGSTFPDHEACLVRLGGGVAAQEEAKSSEYYPLLRALVGQDVPRYQLRDRRKHITSDGPGEKAVYVNDPRNLAVLYLVEPRCFDISEIAG